MPYLQPNLSRCDTGVLSGRRFRLITQGTSPQQTVAIRDSGFVSGTSSIETVNLPQATIPQTIEIGAAKSTIQNKGEAIKQTVVHQSFKVLEISPIVLSLAHNYWQWLYVSNQSSAGILDFITSVHFLLWLLLLLTASVVSLVGIKYSQNKGFAYTSLVILAINFILFLVPKR